MPYIQYFFLKKSRMLLYIKLISTGKKRWSVLTVDDPVQSCLCTFMFSIFGTNVCFKKTSGLINVVQCIRANVAPHHHPGPHQLCEINTGCISNHHSDAETASNLSKFGEHVSHPWMYTGPNVNVFACVKVLALEKLNSKSHTLQHGCLLTERSVTYEVDWRHDGYFVLYASKFTNKQAYMCKINKY